jgi:hypothetical protein
MLDEIYETLSAEILADPAQADLFSENLLKSKIKSAYREVKAARKYPTTYSEEQIAADMDNFHSNVEDIARYDYNAVGSEGMSSYSADGTSIHYRDRDKLFYGVYPIAR